MRIVGLVSTLILYGCSTIVDADSSRLQDSGVPVECDLDCNDNVECTRDECTNNACQHVPISGRCDTGFVCDPNATGSGCVPEDCDLDCTQIPGCPGDSCYDCDQAGYCNATGSACLYHFRDADEDGHSVAQAGSDDCSELDPNADDCDDTNPDRHPDHPEVCDGLDNNCDDVEDNGPCLGDRCTNPLEITLSDGSFIHEGELVYYENDFNFSIDDPMGGHCNQSGGRDVVYRFQVSQLVDLHIKAESTSSPAIDPVLAVRSGASCFSGANDFTYNGTCHNDINAANTNSSIFIQGYGGAGSKPLFILLKGYNSSSTGSFKLTVTATAATGPMCSNSDSQIVNISEGGLLISRLGPDGNSSGAFGNCEDGEGSGEGDSAARFNLASAGVQGSGSLEVVSSSFNPIMYLFKNSCSGTEVICTEEGNPLALGFLGWNLDLGTKNYVIIDGGDEDDIFFLRYQPPEP